MNSIGSWRSLALIFIAAAGRSSRRGRGGGMGMGRGTEKRNRKKELAAPGGCAMLAAAAAIGFMQFMQKYLEKMVRKNTHAECQRKRLRVYHALLDCVASHGMSYAVCSGNLPHPDPSINKCGFQLYESVDPATVPYSSAAPRAGFAFPMKESIDVTEIVRLARSSSSRDQKTTGSRLFVVPCTISMVRHICPGVPVKKSSYVDPLLNARVTFVISHVSGVS